MAYFGVYAVLSLRAFCIIGKLMLYALIRPKYAITAVQHNYRVLGAAPNKKKNVGHFAYLAHI